MKDGLNRNVMPADRLLSRRPLLKRIIEKNIFIGGTLMGCPVEINKELCNCTNEQCPRKYNCCECLHHHRKKGQLPACYFTADFEKIKDRSIAAFIKMHQG
jgi:hypothetical protein